MRKNALIFAGTAIACIFLLGFSSVVGLFVFGFVWLGAGDT